MTETDDLRERIETFRKTAAEAHAAGAHLRDELQQRDEALRKLLGDLQRRLDNGLTSIESTLQDLLERADAGPAGIDAPDEAAGIDAADAPASPPSTDPAPPQAPMPVWRPEPDMDDELILEMSRDTEDVDATQTPVGGIDETLRSLEGLLDERPPED